MEDEDKGLSGMKDSMDKLVKQLAFTPMTAEARRILKSTESMEHFTVSMSVLTWLLIGEYIEITKKGAGDE